MRSFFTRFFLPFVLFIAGQQVLAQDSSFQRVRIQVNNQDNTPLPFATVTLTGRMDTIIVYSKVADSSGTVQFEQILVGPYTISITSVNYSPFEKGMMVNNGKNVFSFAVDPLPKTMTGVVVTSRRPLMRQEDDKTIVDPEALVASSTSGFEVIEKTPGLFVDQDGNIYISSMRPATIFINGREMKMSTADVATMLKSLPPNAIDKIEILRTPSARYDASGSGGIVNVVLKKGIKIGMTGSITAGGQQGTLGNQFLGFTLNNSEGKRSSYINLNVSARNTYEKIVTDRMFAPDSVLKQNAYTRYPGKTFYAGAGTTYEVNKKWEVGYDARVNVNQYNNQTDNRSSISKISTGALITDNLNKVSNEGLSLVLSNDLSSKYKIDSAGSEWTNGLTYTFAKTNGEQVFNTAFYSPVNAETAGDGDIGNNRHYIAFQSDLTWKWPKSFTVETGLKSSFQQFNNETEYFREVGGSRTKDNNRTNTFRYRENINAVYLQGSKTLGEVVIKFGTRLENTNMNGRQIVPGDTTFTIHRTDLFPYVYLSRKLMTIAGFDLRAYLVYRRSITRPVYEQLNPFPRYIDQYLSESGNPTLRPQFTTNYEANISVDERPILAVGYNDTKDIFTNVIYQADSSQQQAFRTYDNLGSNKEWYFRALGAIPPGGVYFFVMGAQYNYNMYDGLYENKPLRFNRGSWTLFTYHMLKLGNRSQATLNGFVRFKGQQQFYELGTFGALNASVNRQFMKQKLVVTLSISDMFASNQNDFYINQGSVQAEGFRQSDTRRIGINIRYNFGIRKKEEGVNMFNISSPG